MRKIVYGIVISCLIVAGISAQGKQQGKQSEPKQQFDLSKEIDRIISKSGLSKQNIGISIYSANTGKKLYEKNAAQGFMLASNAKLFTTSCSLVKLGKDYKFSTRLYYNGLFKESGALLGDLVVIGSGDPNISGRFHNGDPTAIFKEWADKLKQNGIKKINGDLLLDDTIFDKNYILDCWLNQDLSHWYVAPVGGLSLNDNCVDITVTGTKVGEKARIELSPSTRFVSIINRTKTVKSGNPEIAFTREDGTNNIIIWGEISASDSYEFNVAIHNPTLFFGTVLKETLAHSGIEIVGNIKIESAKDKSILTPTAAFETSLMTTITVANRNSQNLYAEQLLKLLGYKFKSFGSTENGIAVVQEFLNEIGIKDVSLADGSGVSKENIASPSAVVMLLSYIYKTKYRNEFINSLAISGENVGTLRKRLKEKNVAGKIRAKTGHISGASALSGYAESADSGTLIFSILVNDEENWRANQLQDDICRLLVKYKAD